jgi:hypothetical protein
MDNRILDVNDAYRKGTVLGLTMAEVAILIIFSLLLLIGFNAARQNELRKSHELVERPALDSLRKEAAIISKLRKDLGYQDAFPVDEVSRLVLAAKKSMGDTKAFEEHLKQLESAKRQLEQIKKMMADSGDSLNLVDQLEQMAMSNANLSGQLKRAEKQLEKYGTGKGERPCWVNSYGDIDYLYDVILQSDGIRMREIENPARVRERAMLELPVVDPNRVLSRREFLDLTRPLFLQSNVDSCRHFVKVYDHTGPTEKREFKNYLLTVEAHFYKFLKRDRATF